MSGEAVRVYLAGSDMPGVVQRLMFPAFNDPARFQILSMAADWSDVQRDVSRYRPDVLVLEAALAPDPETLRDYLTQLVGTIAVLVLPPAWAERQGQFESLRTSVRSVFIGPPSWAAVASATHTAVVTERTRVASASPAAGLYQERSAPRVSGQVVVGTRVIAFTSFTGGTGKSSIAEALGVELARNHVRTLLCSFNSPPAAAGHFNLRLQPNVAEWLNRPTSEGFQASIQHVKGLEDLDIVMAPNDPHPLNQIAGSRPPEAADSIRSLVFSAYSFNYGAILLDLPPFADSMWALQPLLAANIALIICRPTRHDQLGAIRTYKLLTEQLAQQIRVPPEAIYGVMNFASPRDTLSERDFQSAIVDTIGSFPPILATFPYVPELPGAQNFGNSPIFESACEGFAGTARSLAGKLIGAGQPSFGKEARSQSIEFFGIRLKWK